MNDLLFFYLHDFGTVNAILRSYATGGNYGYANVWFINTAYIISA
jgi:hypothetical protein